MASNDETHRKRCRRYDVLGHAHYVTFSCYHRQPFLSKERPIGWLVDAIDSARVKAPFDLWAYIIMPEHVHLLLLPHERVQISAVLHAIKLPVSRRALNWAKNHSPEALARMRHMTSGGQVSYRFWQRGGGYDRNIWTVEELAEKVHYMHANPVRRGLVSHPRQWRWSSWRAWHEGIPEPLKVDRESFPMLQRK
ncbi:MAG: transposase [Planctomycetes bacterium]|nr:transposase [Planctomycetota bacterium]